MTEPTAIRLTEVKLPLDHPPEAINAAACERLKLKPDEIVSVSIFRRGFDARKKSDIYFIYTLDVQTSDNAAVLARAQRAPKLATHTTPTPDTAYKFVTHAPDKPFKRPVVIGTGPCGLFAALTLAQMGFKPIILERGKMVRERTKDTWGFWRKSQLQPESNVQFGEGGAGTFSDGKLWSQVKDPLFHGRKVLEDMVRGGAPDEIMYVSKPHVGTFRLVKVVEFLREEITALGGEFRFSSKVTDIYLDKQPAVLVNRTQAAIKGVALEDGAQIEADHVVLAIGHSARDTFEMLHAKGVYMEAKPFSVGFRIEHPQGLIDRARFGPFAGNPMLGAADYKLVHHAKNGRSVYSFCMCPGGTVVAATSEAGRVVTNGMSQYSRNERNANAGIVVGIEPADFDFDALGNPLCAEKDRGHVLAGMRFQRALESGAYVLGGSTYEAPGQRVGDFLKGIATTQLGSVEPSYQPGVHLTDLGNPLQPSLPMYAIRAMREAIPQFAKQIAGFDMPDAMLTGVETRTSAPVRIKRHEERRAALRQAADSIA
ncbi:MAG: FAD-dependent oxidoreductase, partial [Burkholderiaceae bacterium]